MPDYTKLAAYLDSFEPSDANYQTVQTIKAKLAFDTSDTQTVNNGGDETLQDNDITMSTPEQQTEDNVEGKVMDSAFPELEAMNKVDENKNKVEAEKLEPKGVSPAELVEYVHKQASAYIRDIFYKDLPSSTKKDVSRFISPSDKVKLIHYGAVVKELVAKVDENNFETATSHVKEEGTPDKDELIKRIPEKYVLVMNDKVIDGHHFLAKCQAADITSSLNVLDLTPARFQKQASLFDVLRAKFQR